MAKSTPAKEVYANLVISNVKLFTKLDKTQGGLQAVLYELGATGHRKVVLKTGETLYLAVKGEKQDPTDLIESVD